MGCAHMVGQVGGTGFDQSGRSVPPLARAFSLPSLRLQVCVCWRAVDIVTQPTIGHARIPPQAVLLLRDRGQQKGHPKVPRIDGLPASTAALGSTFTAPRELKQRLRRRVCPIRIPRQTTSANPRDAVVLPDSCSGHQRRALRPLPTPTDSPVLPPTRRMKFFSL